MKLKSLLMVFLLMYTLFQPVEVKSHSVGYGLEKIPWWGWCLLMPIAVIGNFVEDTSKSIDDSRRLTIRVEGVKAEFKKNTVQGYDKKRGTISSGHLVIPIEIIMKGRKLEILPGEMSFYEKGNIKKCLIRSAALYRGGDTIVESARYAEFYENGYLKRTFLSTDERGGMFSIQGKERLLRGDVWFYENGLIHFCSPGEESEFLISDYRAAIKGGSTIEFTEEGRPVYIRLPYNESMELKLRGAPVRLAGEISLHENGMIRHCTLTESVVMRNGIHSLRVSGEISFYDNEMISECLITNPISLKAGSNTLEFDKSETWRKEVLRFYRNGNVKSGRLTNNKKQTYLHKGSSLQLKDGSSIHFYESGVLKSFTPLDKSAVNAGGINLTLRDDEIFFFEEGGILSAVAAGGSEFLYDGRKLQAGKYRSRIYFYRSGEAAAFTGDSARQVSAGKGEFILPAYSAAGYSDYEKGKILFASVRTDNIKFPGGMFLKKDDIYTYPLIFVRAGNFYNDEKKEKIYASDVKEIMFSRNYRVIINGREVFCKAMEWIKISD